MVLSWYTSFRYKIEIENHIQTYLFLLGSWNEATKKKEFEDGTRVGRFFQVALRDPKEF